LSKFRLVASPGKIIVKSDDFKYTGMLHIPDAAKRRPTIGEVVAVGRGVGYYETVFDGADGPKEVFTPYWNIGDKVAFGVYSGVVL